MLAMAGIYYIVIMVVVTAIDFIVVIIIIIQIGINKKCMQLLEPQTYSLHIYW